MTNYGFLHLNRPTIWEEEVVQIPGGIEMVKILSMPSAISLVKVKWTAIGVRRSGADMRIAEGRN